MVLICGVRCMAFGVKESVWETLFIKRRHRAKDIIDQMKVHKRVSRAEKRREPSRRHVDQIPECHPEESPAFQLPWPSLDADIGCKYLIPSRNFVSGSTKGIIA